MKNIYQCIYQWTIHIYIYIYNIYIYIYICISSFKRKMKVAFPLEDAQIDSKRNKPLQAQSET